jgi:uncharacterized protein (TIGR03086 family)
VRDLLGHLIGGATHFAAVMRGEESAEPAQVSDESMVAAATAAVVDLDDAFRTPGALERIVETPFGELPGETFARLLAFDLLMHTWDLATATGQKVDVPPTVVDAVSAFAHSAVTPDLRGPQTFGPEAQVPDDASALDELVAFAGRHP